MAYNEKDGLVDIFGGREDLQQGIIRCVGTPRERFTEDALRMLRALRFSAQLGFSIDEATFEAIRELAPTIRKVSAERIQAELVKLVMSDHPEVMRQVYESGLADQFLPEFSTMMKTPQNTPHHKYTVGEHTICAMQNIRADRVLRLTMLLHDVGKPVCRTTDPTGRDHFIGHPQVGARMAREIFRRLKFDNETIRRVSAMVAAHDMRPPLEERAVRRAMVKAGPEYFPVLFEVSRADILAQSSYKQKEKLHNVDVHERICREIIRKHQALSRKDLAVTGRDLMAAGMKPGKGLGDVLDRLLDHVLEFPEDNKRERLMELANRFRSE